MSHASILSRRHVAQARAALLAALAGALLCMPAPVAAHEGIGPALCEPLPELQAWLERHARLWDPVLSAEPGYEKPAQFTVCRLESSRPFADNHSNRVFVRRLQTTDDAITLTHEYLHLAFAHYPSGHDERYVENTARRLIANYP